MANGISYTYDACGNMITRGIQKLAYNAENQLKAIDLDNNGTEDVEFGYDFAGQRLWRKKNGVLTGIWIGGVYEYKDSDADGTGLALCHVHSEVGLIASFEPNPTQDSVFYYYHSDHLGSSSVLTNREGDPQKHYGYSVFGDERYDDADYFANMAPSNRYTGQVLDEDTGLYYYNARYYDPLLGRFIQPDTVLPSLSSQGLNRYSYVNNNPLKFTDPSGNVPTLSLDSSTSFDFSWSSMSSYALNNSSSSSYMSGPSYNGAGALSNSIVGSTNDISMYGKGMGMGMLACDPYIGMQRIANFIQGVQDSIVGMINLLGNAKGYGNTNIWMDVQRNPEYFQYQELLSSSQWAKNLFVTQSDFEYGFDKFYLPILAGYVCNIGLGSAGLLDDAAGLTDNVAGLTDDVAGLTDDVAVLTDEATRTLKPGPFSNNSIPARSSARNFTAVERSMINDIGIESGCHTCGSKIPGTKSGNFVPDHQPVSALNINNAPQRLYPHCINCSREQGLTVARKVKK